MPKKTFLRTSGTWREAKNIWVKVGGVWRSVNRKYVKDGGNWRLVFIRAFTFSDTINTLVFNYNLANAAMAAGWDGTTQLEATVTVTNIGAVASTSTSIPSFLIPTLPVGSSVTIYNNGVIAGRGGNGGIGAPSGECGCLPGGNGSNGGPALQVQFPSFIYNTNIIGGGGGGGGGGGAECAYIWNASAGGGGGGAGFGQPGGNNHCGVTLGRFGGPGSPGTLTTGGLGGSRGNMFTANGGNGGNLGQSGLPGQTIHAAGGTGGAPGNAIVGIANILNWPGIGGSILGPVS